MSVRVSSLPPGGGQRWHWMGQWISRNIVRPCYRPRIRGRENVPPEGPIVMVANHSANVDGPLLLGMVPRNFVFLVKSEVFRGPLGWFLRKLGQIPVKRGQPDRAPLMAAADVLRGGGMVGIFPEGRRGDGQVGHAHHGAAWLARMTKARLLPVVCAGTQRPEGGRKRWRPRVDFLFGEPFEIPQGKGRAGLEAATEHVQAELVALLERLELERTNTRA